MASNLPESWDEAEFIEDVSRRPELSDISNDLYSNNEHRWYIFRQIGVNHNVDGENFFFISIQNTSLNLDLNLFFCDSKYFH